MALLQREHALQALPLQLDAVQQWLQQVGQAAKAELPGVFQQARQAAQQMLQNIQQHVQDWLQQANAKVEQKAQEKIQQAKLSRQKGILAAQDHHAQIADAPLEQFRHREPGDEADSANAESLEQAKAIGMAAGLIALSMLPGVGEAMDLWTLFDSESAWWERGLAGLSLLLSAVTWGLTPNFGAWVRASRMLARAANRLDNVAAATLHAAKRWKQSLLCKRLHLWCFTADMCLLTRRGWVPMDQLQEGDEVLALPEGQPHAQPNWYRIDRLFQTRSVVWHVHVQSIADNAVQVIRTTAQHRFYVQHKEWVETQHLSPGDCLQDHKGQAVLVQEVFNTGVQEPVYNCRVMQAHTYFVGQPSWGFSVWSHNKCDGRVGQRLEDAQGVFFVAKHADMPVPRPGLHSHHGVMSAWMQKRFPNYDASKAPAILMPEANHRATFGVYNRWRARMRQKMGGKFDWGKVTEDEMRSLSEEMFDAANVPQGIRNQYWEWFDRMKEALSQAKGGSNVK